MITLERHGDVTRLVMTSWRSRMVGFSVSAYAVRGVVIDCGFHSVRDALAQFLRESSVRGVIVTHQHEDHAGNIDLVARLGIPLGVSAATVEEVRRSRRIGFYRRFTWEPMPPLSTPHTPFVDESLEMVSAPGHTRDHHVVWDATSGTLFSGDLFLGVKVRVAHRGEDPRDLVRTLRQVASLGPARMFDAHRGLVANPVAALRAKADWIEETVARVQERIARGWTDDQITRDVLGGEEFVGYFSRGDYARKNWVRNVRRRGEGHVEPSS